MEHAEITRIGFYSISPIALTQIRSARRAPGLNVSQWLTSVIDTSNAQTVNLLTSTVTMGEDALNVIQLKLKKRPITIMVSEARQIILFAMEGVRDAEELVFVPKSNRVVLRSSLGDDQLNKLDKASTYEAGEIKLDNGSFSVSPFANELMNYHFSKHAKQRATQRFGIAEDMLPEWLRGLAKSARMVNQKNKGRRVDFVAGGVQFQTYPEREEIASVYPSNSMPDLPMHTKKALEDVMVTEIADYVSHVVEGYKTRVSDLAAELDTMTNGTDEDILGSFLHKASEIQLFADEVSVDVLTAQNMHWVVNSVSCNDQDLKTDNASLDVDDRIDESINSMSDEILKRLAEAGVGVDDMNEVLSNGRMTATKETRQVLLDLYKEKHLLGDNLAISMTSLVQHAKAIGIRISTSTMYRLEKNSAQ